jgi:hypothetical protein
MKRATTTAILACLTVLALAGVADACPNCKDTVANTAAAGGPGAPGAGLPGGFNTSIYYMLGGLFAVLGTGGYFVVRTIRQTDAAASAATRRGFPVGD